MNEKKKEKLEKIIETGMKYKINWKLIYSVWKLEFEKD